MARGTHLCLLIVLAASCAAPRDAARPSSAESQAAMRSLLEGHEWFQLRDVVVRDGGSAFYRGIVASVFNADDDAERYLRQVIDGAPASDDAMQARGTLIDMYSRAGRYQHALALVDQLLAVNPDSAKWSNSRSFLAAFSEVPEQSVESRAASRVTYRRRDGNLVLPVSVNGHAASFIVDDGANISTISASEATRMGLIQNQARGTADGYSGQLSVRTATAATLAVGQFRLKNVAFVVLDDDQEPFAELSPGEQGLIGLPVLLAFGTLRWGADGSFEFGFPSMGADARQSNVAFDGLTPVMTAQFDTATLVMGLDMGAQESHLFPNFATAFPRVVVAGHKDTIDITGFGQSAPVESITVPEVTLRIGGVDAIFRPARVLLQQRLFGHRYFGNIGMDLLGQGRVATLDFPAMRFVMQQ